MGFHIKAIVSAATRAVRQVNLYLLCVVPKDAKLCLPDRAEGEQYGVTRKVSRAFVEHGQAFDTFFWDQKGADLFRVRVWKAIVT